MGRLGGSHVGSPGTEGNKGDYGVRTAEPPMQGSAQTALVVRAGGSTPPLTPPGREERTTCPTQGSPPRPPPRGTWFCWQSSGQGRPTAKRPVRERHAG